MLPAAPRRAVAQAFALALAACGGAPPAVKGHDPFEDAKFAPLGGEQLRAAALPEGYRLGDRGLAATADGDRPWRWARSPNGENLLLRAHGKGDRIDYAQLVYNDASKKDRTWLEGAGVKLGALVALGRARSRDWGRLSQGHAVDERWPVRLYATEVPGMFVQLRYGDALDAIDWCRDQELLLAEDERVSVAEALASLERAVAARQWGEVSTWVDRCGPLTGADQARVAAANQALLAHRAQVNGPVLAELDKLKQEHDAAWAPADTYGKVKLYAQNQPRASALADKLEAGTPELAWHMGELWLDFAKTQQAQAKAAPEPGAVAAYWDWVCNGKRHEMQAILQCYTAAVSLDGVRTTFPLALSCRRDLSLFSVPVLATKGEQDLLARRLLAKVARQCAADERKAGNELRAEFFEQVVARDLDTLSLPADVAYPYPEPAEWDATWNSVLDYERARMGEASVAIGLLHRRLAMAAGITAARERNRQPASTFASFLQRQIAEQVHRLRLDADGSAAKGLAATACVLELMAMDAEGGAVDIQQDVVTPTSPAVRYARPMLAEVLPPLEPTVPQAGRLCELLAEGSALDWPIVRYLGLGTAPGDVLRLRVALDAPVRVVSPKLATDGSRATLEAVSPGADHYAGSLAWQNYSGWSPETYKEGEWVRGESTWLIPEQKALDAEKAELDASANQSDLDRKQLDVDLAALEKQRATVTDGGVAEFNRKVAELNRRKDDFNQRAAAWRKRADAHVERSNAFNKRVDLFNRRLAALNEQRMRESAAGAVKTDGLLLPALTAAVDEGLDRWRAAVRARGIGAGEVEEEMRFARWLFGRAADGPQLWTRREGKGYCQLQAAAALRLATLQATNKGYAQKIAVWCRWSLAGEVPGREETFVQHVDEFVRHRDVSVLADALRQENTLSIPETRRLLDVIEQRKKAIFGK